MGTFRLTFTTDRGPELVEADSAAVEDRFVVLRKSVLVVGAPREVVVRRLLGSELLSVDEL